MALMPICKSSLRTTPFANERHDIDRIETEPRSKRIRQALKDVNDALSRGVDAIAPADWLKRHTPHGHYCFNGNSIPGLPPGQRSGRSVYLIARYFG